MNLVSGAIPTKLNVVWRRQLKNEWINAAPVVFDNKIFTGTVGGTVLALNAQSGELVWERQLSGIQAAFGVYGDILMIPDHGGTLHGLKVDSGQTVWSLPVNGPAVNPVTVVNGTAYVTTLTGYVYAINAETGEIDWNRRLGRRIVAKPAVWNGTVFLPTAGSSHSLHALDARDGTPVWERTFAKSVDKSIRVSDGFVYAFGKRNNIVRTSVGSQRGSIFKIDPEEGRVDQSISLQSRHFGNSDCGVQSLVASDYGIYATACNVVFLFDKNGREIWQLTMGDGIATNLISSKNGVLFADFDAALHRGSRQGEVSQLSPKTNPHPIVPCVFDNTMIFCTNRSVSVLKWA